MPNAISFARRLAMAVGRPFQVVAWQRNTQRLLNSLELDLCSWVPAENAFSAARQEPRPINGLIDWRRVRAR